MGGCKAWTPERRQVTPGGGHSSQHRSQYGLMVTSLSCQHTETWDMPWSSSLLMPSDRSDTWSALPRVPKLRLRDGITLDPGKILWFYPCLKHFQLSAGFSQWHQTSPQPPHGSQGCLWSLPLSPSPRIPEFCAQFPTHSVRATSAVSSRNCFLRLVHTRVTVC